jgi:hypothetical protein
MTKDAVVVPFPLAETIDTLQYPVLSSMRIVDATNAGLPPHESTTVNPANCAAAGVATRTQREREREQPNCNIRVYLPPTK